MKFFVHKLGCPKNDVDADYISARLIDDGHTPVGSVEEAESVIVNTCGFINDAKEESIDEILRIGELKRDGLKTLYASGCLTQRHGDEMLKEIPELDGAFGHGALDSIAEAVGSSRKISQTIKKETRKLGYLTWKSRFISDGYPYSYLKISDGCDRVCTYCAIPSMRGRFRSRPLDSIVNEAEFLAANGKKELILVSQEATFWGYGLSEQPSIMHLLRRLEEVDGVHWIRPMYLYPSEVKDDLIEYMAGDNKTLNYYDLPLQHVNTEMLSRMKRLTDRPGIDSLIKRIRKTSDDAIIRTTFIVGFPGETEDQFEQLLDAIDEYRFDRLGVFTYSSEEGTPAAEMPGQIPEEVKAERMDRVMNLQREIAFEHNSLLIGQQIETIIDAVKDSSEATGRTYGDCPEIDQEIKITGGSLQVGDICRVEVVSAEGYDLTGRVVEKLA